MLLFSFSLILFLMWSLTATVSWSCPSVGQNSNTFFVCVELVDTLAALSLPLTKQATSPNRNHSSPFSAHFTVKSTRTSCIETGSAIHGFAIKEVRWRPRVTYQLYFLLVVENKIQLPHFTPLHVKKSNKFKIVNKLHFAGIQVCFKWVKLLNVG